jgi:hypothetical protein
MPSKRCIITGSYPLGAIIGPLFFRYLCDLQRAHDLGIPVLVWGTGWDDEGSISQAQLDLLADPAFGLRSEDHITIGPGPLLDSFVMAGRAAQQGVGGGGVRGPYTSKVMEMVLSASASAAGATSVEQLGEEAGGSSSRDSNSNGSPQYALPMVGDSGLLAARLLNFRARPLPASDMQASPPHSLSSSIQGSSLNNVLADLAAVLPPYAELSVAQDPSVAPTTAVPPAVNADAYGTASGGGDGAHDGIRVVVVNYGRNKPGTLECLAIQPSVRVIPVKPQQCAPPQQCTCDPSLATAVCTTTTVHV